MADCELDNPLPSRVPALHLDYGTDAQSCEPGGLEISERGIRMVSRWEFSVGTRMAVVCVRQNPVCGLERVSVEALVVQCRDLVRPGFPGTSFETVLLFLDLPEEVKPLLRNFSGEVAGLCG